ncbi:MAG: hypothetical protein UY85_C0048G0002 [Candidatus Peribacteria bacterium GW2011_GWB1_54_5]|nr:MAG: hypothetical protein UY85_C0048G0002 [Candidatus Peribacteria bacterium GW2011_GWB1_54_5]
MIIGTLTAFLLTGCTLQEPKEETTQQTPPIREAGILFTETAFDFGTIKQSGGKVSHDFAFTYAGDAPIVITAIPTSCACASAEVDRRELESGESVTMLTKPPLPSQPEVKIWAEIDLDLGPEAFELKDEHAHTSDEPENHQ